MLVFYVMFLATAPLHVEKDCHHDGDPQENSGEEGHETHHCCSPLWTLLNLCGRIFPQRIDSELFGYFIIEVRSSDLATFFHS